MIASKDNWKDVNKYYNHTYVKFPSEGERVWFISDVNQHRILARDRTEEEVFVDLKKPFKIEYVLPKKAVYQHGEQAACLFRLPQRMWKKGLSNENTMLQRLGSTGSWSTLDFSLDNIEGFVNKPGYYGLEDALHNFKEGQNLISAALSPRVSVTRSGKVFIDTIQVGRLTKGTLAIKEIYISDVAHLFPNTKVKAI